MKKLAVYASLMSVSLCFASEVIAQESSREQFQEFCKAIQGRWVGDVTWVADWPGLGKRGDKVTAYFEGRLAEDGNAMVGKFYGGNGSGTWIIVFDAGAKQIKGLFVTSGGAVNHTILYKKDGKWVEKGAGSLPDGAKTEFVSTLTITNNGDTHTWTGSGSVGGKKHDDQHDVWRRVSK